MLDLNDDKPLEKPGDVHTSGYVQTVAPRRCGLCTGCADPMNCADNNPPAPVQFADPAKVQSIPLEIVNAGRTHQDGELYVFRFNRDLTKAEATWLYETLKSAIEKKR